MLVWKIAVYLLRLGIWNLQKLFEKNNNKFYHLLMLLSNVFLLEAVGQMFH